MTKTEFKVKLVRCLDKAASQKKTLTTIELAEALGVNRSYVTAIMKEMPDLLTTSQGIPGVRLAVPYKSIRVGQLGELPFMDPDKLVKDLP